MNILRRPAVLAAFVVTVSFGCVRGQLPDWTSIPVSPTATAGIEASVVRIVDGNTVWLYSALARAWTSITSQSSSPVVTVYNDHVMVRDGTTFYGYSPRNPTPAQLTTTAGTLVSTAATTWYSVVLDGTRTYVFLAYYGIWVSVPTAAAATVVPGRWAALVSDGTTVWGIRAYFTNPVVLNAPGAVAASAFGCQAFATSLGAVHAFSASRATWTTLPVFGTPSITNGASQSGYSVVQDGPYVHFFSGMRGSFTSTTRSASASLLTTSRTTALIVDGTTVKAYSSLKGTISTIVYPSVPTTLLKDYFALLSDGTTLLAFSGTHGAFSAPLVGYTLGSLSGMNLATALDPTSGNLAYVYSAYRNAWTPGPVAPAAVQQVWVNGLCVLVQSAGSLHGLATDSGAWTTIAAPAPEMVWNGGGDWMARNGTTLWTFNPNRGTFSTQLTNAPVTQGNMHDNTHIAIDGDGTTAYAFSHYTDRWAAVQLSGPVLQFGAEKQCAYVNDGVEVHAFAGIGQVSNVNEYPDWVRVMPVGGLFLGHLSGEIGATAIFAASAVRTELATPYGTLYLDPTALFPFYVGPIPASGVLSLPLQVPDLPTLTGARLWFQAMIQVGAAAPYLTEFAQTTIL